jgi:hypothetical protein
MVFRRLFRLQPANLRCDSRIGNQTVTLCSEFIRSANNVRVEFSLLWPLLLTRPLPPAIMLQVVSSDGQRILDTIHRPGHRSCRKTRVNLEIAPAAIQTNKALNLRVLRQKDSRALLDIPLPGFDLGQVAQELRVTSFETFAIQNGQHIPCDHLHDAVEQAAFVVRLKLDNPEHESFLRQTGAELSVELCRASGESKPPMNWGRGLEFKAGSFEWRQKLGPAPALFNGALGSYALIMRLGETVVARKPLLAMSFNQCLEAAKNQVRQQARLQDAACTVVNHRGVAVPLTTVAEDFKQIDISLAFDLPDPDPLIPAVELPLGFVVRRGKTEVLRRQQLVSLKAGLNRLEFTVALSAAVFEPGPGRYEIETRLDERLVKSLDFLHKTRAQLKKEKAETIWRSLSLKDHRLWAGRDGSRVETDHVFATDQAIVSTFRVAAQGFDEDAPALRWRLTIRLIHMDANVAAEDYRYLQTRAGGTDQDEVEIPLRGSQGVLRPGSYKLQLRKRGELLAEFQFRLLPAEEIVPYTRQMILQSLRAAQPNIVVEAGGIRYHSPWVPQTSDRVILESTLYSTGYNSHVPALSTELEFFLRRGEQISTLIARLPVTLSPGPLTLPKIAIKVRDGWLGETAGICHVLIASGGTNVAQFPIEVVSEARVLEQVEVSAINWEAVCKSRRQVRNPATLHLSEHEALLVGVDIEVGILAPNLLVEGALVLRLGRTVVAHVDFNLRLSQPSNTFRGKKVRLHSLIAPGSLAEQKLTIAVLIAGEEKGTRLITVVCAERITSNEGQLTIDPRRIEVDDAEYQQILSSL